LWKGIRKSFKRRKINTTSVRRNKRKKVGKTMSQEAMVKIGKKFASLSFEEVEKISTEEQGRYENPH